MAIYARERTSVIVRRVKRAQRYTVDCEQEFNKPLIVLLGEDFELLGIDPGDPVELELSPECMEIPEPEALCLLLKEDA